MDTRFGFVGVGNMGGPMAARLAERGGDVQVYDIDAGAVAPVVASGARAADSVEALARTSDVVMTCLPSVAAARQVAEQVIAGASGGTGKTYVEMSTIGYSAALELAGRLEAAGLAVVDAPVSGGGEAARRGSLTIMISGPEGAIAAARPGLELIGKRLIEVSAERGHAQVMKLLNNLCALSFVGITLEACAFGAKAGLDPDKMLEVLNVSSGRSGSSRFVMPQVVSGRFESGASMEIAYKDVALAVQEAEKLGVPMWLGNAAAQLWRHGVMHAGGAPDMSHLADLIESWSGVEIRS